MVKPRELRAIANHSTIAYIAILLIALTASRLGNKNKAYFIKSFHPNILFLKSESLKV